MLIFLGLIIPIISFFFQAYPRFFNKYFGVDVWSRMIEADYIRKNNHRIPMQKIKDGFLLEGFYNYPPVFPWLLSFISKKKLFELQGFIAPIFDVLQNFLIFLITLEITGRVDVALLAQLIYASIPLIIIENSYLTPRSLGYLNFTLAIYPLLMFSINNAALYLGVAFIFMTLSFFTHKFAAQSIFFACLFFSIIDNRSSLYLLTFLLSLLTAILVSRGYYLRVLQGHLDNIRFWMTHYEYRFAHQVRGLIKQHQQTDFVGQIYYFLSRFSPIALFGTNCWLIFPIFYFLHQILDLNILTTLNHPVLFKLSLLSVFFYILASAVLSIKYLIPIGEGQRYLEMVTVPTAIISAIIFFELLNSPYRILVIIIFLGLIIMNILVTVFLQWKGILKDRSRSLTKDMNKVFNFLNKMQPAPRILCIPHQITTLILFNTKTNVLVDIQAGTLQKIPDVFPIITSPIKDIAKKYNLNTLVLRKDYASLQELGLSKRDVLFESDDTQIIRLRP